MVVRYLWSFLLSELYFTNASKLYVFMQIWPNLFMVLAFQILAKSERTFFYRVYSP